MFLSAFSGINMKLHRFLRKIHLDLVKKLISDRFFERIIILHIANVLVRVNITYDTLVYNNYSV